MINPKKLVCIFAHPDDEAFGPSGSIAYFAERSEVHIICVTKGDADEKFTNTNDVSNLGNIRQKELEESAEILGVKSVINLNFKDGSLNNNNYHDVVKAIEPILKEIKPDTVMTFDQNGVSGHIDHVAVSMETTYLFERLNFIKNLMYFCEDKLIKKLIGKKYFIYYPTGNSSSEVDLVIDVSQYFSKKIKAIKAHVSQKSDARIILTVFRPFLKKEYFKVLTK